MPRTTLAILALLLAPSCGGGDDAPLPPDGASPPDAALPADGQDGGGDAMPTETRVTGTLDGVAFTLRYAAIEWGGYYDTLCVSNVPITAPDCGYGDSMRKLVLYGKLKVWPDGRSEWAFPQVELREIGGAAGLELARGGSLAVTVHDPPGGQFAASFDLLFASGPTSGLVVIP